MKPRPVRTKKAEGYPDRREFLAALAGGALALALTRSLRGESSEGSDTDLKKQIADLAADLGSKNFKKRDVATKELIRIGKGNGRDNDVDAKAKKLVLAEMNALKGHKDPEVSQRVKAVILALAPPPPPPKVDPPQVLGEIHVRGLMRKR